MAKGSFRRGFICWLKGCHWHVTEERLKNGEHWKYTHYFALSHCARCGNPSPTLTAHQGEQKHG
mgnify:CR=1 FL=1